MQQRIRSEMQLEEMQRNEMASAPSRVSRLFSRHEQRTQRIVQARIETDRDNADEGKDNDNEPFARSERERERERESDGVQSRGSSKPRALLDAIQRRLDGGSDGLGDGTRQLQKVERAVVAKDKLKAALLRTVAVDGEANEIKGDDRGKESAMPRRQKNSGGPAVVSLGRLAARSTGDGSARAGGMRQGRFNHYGDAIVAAAIDGGVDATADASWEARGTMRLGFGNADVD